MSRAIYKFPFAVEDVQHVVMPRGARLLTVGVQDGVPVIWAAVDDGVYIGRKIAVVPTGGTPPAGGTYVGTFTLDGDLSRFVGHVYDLGEQTVAEHAAELGLVYEDDDEEGEEARNVRLIALAAGKDWERHRRRNQDPPS